MKNAIKLLAILTLFTSVSSNAQSFDWLKTIKHENATVYVAKDGHWLIDTSSIRLLPNKSGKFSEYIKRVRKATTAQAAAKVVLQQIVDTSKNSTTGYISVNDELNFYYTPIVEAKSPEATQMPSTSLLLRHYRNDIKQVMEIVLAEVSAVKKHSTPKTFLAWWTLTSYSIYDNDEQDDDVYEEWLEEIEQFFEDLEDNLNADEFMSFQYEDDDGITCYLIYYAYDLNYDGDVDDDEDMEYYEDDYFCH